MSRPYSYLRLSSFLMNCSSSCCSSVVIGISTSIFLDSGSTVLRLKTSHCARIGSCVCRALICRHLTRREWRVTRRAQFRRHRLHHFSCALLHLCRFRDANQQTGEFITTEARDRVAAAHRTREPSADDVQQFNVRALARRPPSTSGRFTFAHAGTQRRHQAPPFITLRFSSASMRSTNSVVSMILATPPSAATICAA